MKKIFEWIGGFFSSENNNSSKRLVGIVGAIFLFITMYKSSLHSSNGSPSDTLVYCVTILVSIALGLTTIEAIGKIISKGKE